MNLRFLFAFIALVVVSCKQSNDKQTVRPGWVVISPTVKMQQTETDFTLISGDKTYKIPLEKLPFKKIIFLNASLIGYVTELGAEDKIAAISSPEYLYSSKIQQLINSGKIQNVGNEQKYDVEKIISLKPDAVFTNYITSFENTYNILHQNGIEVIFLNEYLEQNPLDKAAYLRVFGKLLGLDKISAIKLGEIRTNYDHLKNLALKESSKPVVIANEMYGSQWFMPGGKTSAATFIKDANADYILKENSEEKAIPMSFEEVFSKAENAKFWVNLGNHKTKAELLAINPNYSKMKVYKTGKLYAITKKEKGKTNDFFESGVVRADLVLKDYIQIFHPGLLPKDSLTYMQELR